MRLVLALVATLALGGAVAAQPPPPPAVTPSPHALELAHRIYEAVGGGAQTQAAAERLMAPLFRSLPAKTSNGKDLRADMMTFVGTELTKYRPQMGQVTERVYAETFSEPELQQLLVFYQSPLGRAYIAKLPELGGRTAALMTPVYAQIRKDTLDHICDLEACTAEQRSAIAKLAGGG